MSLSAMRFAHTEGHCGLTFTPDGKSVLTCGSDGEVRVYRGGLNDDDPTSHLVGDDARAICCIDERFFVGSANQVQAYTIEEGSTDGVIAKFTADVSCLDIQNEWIAAGSEDMTVKVVHIESFKSKTFEGHEAPVLSIALDPKSEFLLSSSCDGTVRLWNTSEAKQLESWSCLPKSNDFSNSPTVAGIRWSSNGLKFAVPVKHSVKVYDRGSWKEQSVLSPETDMESIEHIVNVTWSPDGRYLAAGTTKGCVVVWEVQTKTVVAQSKTSRGYGITAIAWNPKKNEVAIIDNHGYWGLVENIGSKGEKSKPAQPTKAKPSSISQEDQDMLDADDLEGLFDDDDDDNENSFSIRKIKAETGFLTDEENSNAVDGESKAIENDLDDMLDKLNQDDEPPKPEAPQPPPARTPQIEIQEPFQPGSTPIHLQSRFMVWNSVGIVRAYNSEEESTIDVEFHDSAVHHSLHVSNLHGHTMADLSKEALLLACEANEEDDTPSRLVCNHFASFDPGNKEWSVEMPAKEDILAICCGEGWVAAATDRRNLRLFTVSGFQREILSLPGPVVALSGHGQFVFVTVHLGSPLPGNQSIGAACFKIGGKGRGHPMPSFQPLPLAPRSFLSWIGFTDEGTPCFMDSAGFVRILNAHYGASWMQICDTKSLTKGKSDHYFMVGVGELEGFARCILCKGSRFPPTVPRPVINMVRLKLPVCHEDLERGVMEQEFWSVDFKLRSVGAEEDAEKLEREQNETLVKLFALACKSDHETRALDICRLMDSHTIQIAIKYASKMRRMKLAEKLSELACVRQEEEEAEEAKQEIEPEESQDMFAMTQEGEDEEETNPLLLAKLKRSTTKSLIPETQSQSEVRNPFKKTKTPTGQTGQIRPGLVFDEMTPTATKTKKSFGSVEPRIDIKPRMKSGKQSTLFEKKTPKDKENTSNNQKDSGLPLKGFQLWLAENEESYPTQDVGMKKWKELSREQKDEYKTPRVPNACKRKREESVDESLPESKKSSFTEKLSRFSAPE